MPIPSTFIALEEQTLEELALKDAQEDEYYQDILTEGWMNSLNELKKNPYPGLRPFKTSEASVFFGRKEITQDLIIRLAKHRFLAVLGASGTGKSSLVRAGLLPGLKILPGKYGLWKVAICRPGKNPFGNLAKAISKANIAPGFTEYAIWEAISSSSYGFEKFYNSDNLKEFNTLIIIDQFEELFRYRKDSISGKNDSSLFVKMLIEISKLEHLNTYVLITMRSEYLGDCVQFSALVDEINDAQFLVPRLKEKQLKEAIVAPTGFSSAKVAEVFAERLLGEMGDNMDQLPVLQHSLRRTYEEAKLHKDNRNGILLTYGDYNKVGRMENAINEHADEIYSGFDNIEKQYCEVLFKCITDKATDGRGIRRPLPFKAILNICTEDKKTSSYSIDEQKSILTKIINCYRADKVNFLMPPLVEQLSNPNIIHIEINEETEIDIAHESIMRIWKRLIQWVEEEAKDADLLKQLLNRESNNYLTGIQLSIYKDFLTNKENAKTWASLYIHKEEEFTKRFEDAIKLIKDSIEQDLQRELEKKFLILKQQNEKEEKLKHEHELKELELKKQLEVETAKRQAQEILANSAKRLRYFSAIMVCLIISLLILLFKLNNNRINNRLNTAKEWMRNEDYDQARKALNYKVASAGIPKLINLPKLDAFRNLNSQITVDSTRKANFDFFIQRIDTLRARKLGDSLYYSFAAYKKAKDLAFTDNQKTQLKTRIEQLGKEANYSFNRYVDKAEAFYRVDDVGYAKSAFHIAKQLFEDSLINALIDKNDLHYLKYLDLSNKIR